jgi:hypothetical protein
VGSTDGPTIDRSDRIRRSDRSIDRSSVPLYEPIFRNRRITKQEANGANTEDTFAPTKTTTTASINTTMIFTRRSQLQHHRHQNTSKTIATAFLALTAALSIGQDHHLSLAFATSTASSTTFLTPRNRTPNFPAQYYKVHSKASSSTMAPSTTSTAVKATDEGTPPPPTKSRRVRITALDGIRALLACHIVLGHFLRYANPPGEYYVLLDGV